MKVLHITNNYPTQENPVFGIFVKEQIDSLYDVNVESEVFFINGRELGKKAYFTAIFELNILLKNKDYDILHCHHSFSAVILLLTFRFSGHKKILSYQNDPDKEGGGGLYKIMSFFMNGIILKNFKNPFLTKKTFYLPNGVDLNFFKPSNQLKSKLALNLNPDKDYVLFMDSYKRRSQKRIDRFNKVIEILKGDLEYKNVEPLILTNTPRKEIPTYLSASSLHIITSDFEGSPNSVKECLACDTQVVSTPVGNVKDLIGDIPGCFISNNFDPVELANLAAKALLIKSFSGRKYISKKELDISTVAKKLKSIYEEIIYE